MPCPRNLRNHLSFAINVLKIMFEMNLPLTKVFNIHYTVPGKAAIGSAIKTEVQLLTDSLDTMLESLSMRAQYP